VTEHTGKNNVTNNTGKILQGYAMASEVKPHITPSTSPSPINVRD
jgi:hypothetical protein